ncbi:hypothetical protein [Luteibacter yeojuensis]|nr:hypothetical protein [Luteibacter yeojuensis]
MDCEHTSTDIEYREIPTWMFALFMGFQFVLLVIAVGTGLYNTYFR